MTMPCRVQYPTRPTRRPAPGHTCLEPIRSLVSLSDGLLLGISGNSTEALLYLAANVFSGSADAIFSSMAHPLLAKPDQDRGLSRAVRTW